MALKLMTSNNVEALEAELAKLCAGAEALAGEVEKFDAAANEAVSAKEVLNWQAEAKAARNRLRHIDAAIADVRERLAAARDASRAAQLAALRAEHTRKAKDFLAKARAAWDAAKEVIGVREAFLTQGFRADYLETPIAPVQGTTVVVDPELLDTYESRLGVAVAKSGRQRTHLTPEPPRTLGFSGPRVWDPDADAPKQSAGSRPRISGPFEVLGSVAASSIAFLGRTSSPSELRPALREAPAAPGDKLFLVHRGTIEHPRTGQRLQAGDAVAMAEDDALPLIRAGAGDFTTAEELARVDAGDALRRTPMRAAQ